MVADHVLRDATRRLAASFKPTRLILFGSQARGTAVSPVILANPCGTAVPPVNHCGTGVSPVNPCGPMPGRESVPGLSVLTKQGNQDKLRGIMSPRETDSKLRSIPTPSFASIKSPRTWPGGMFFRTWSQTPSWMSASTSTGVWPAQAAYATSIAHVGGPNPSEARLRSH